ncbi:MAG: glycine cleavage system aminomethyltransferase GcvT [Actinomycetia bacterium]|nr:glycine cleavage system aminomethyltransferase GcvT [Actinomycetes bacterium]
MTDPIELRSTPLHALHEELGARMVPFAGWSMPVQYPEGVMAEHLWTRSGAGLFDVSHMRTLELHGPDRVEALERLVPASITGIAEGRVRYTFFTDDRAGILDDLMVTNAGPHLSMVVNAGRAESDLEHLRTHLPASVEVVERTDLGLLAVQGPKAVDALARLAPEVADLTFLDAGTAHITGLNLTVTLSRSGYTGEDGYELAVPNDHLESLARLLLAEPEVRPSGLGARDTLRLEAGLCLYGNDLDDTTTPVEADLVWAIQKRRREEGGFPGHDVVMAQLADGPTRVRVGIAADGRRPIRDGATLQAPDGETVGLVTSGGFGPTVERPVAMGYVPPSLAEPGTALVADVRGKPEACTVANLPFTPHRYVR